MARMRIGAGVLLALAGTMAMAQDGDSFGWGAEIGAFLPTDSTIRDLLGGTWLSYGIKPVSIKVREGVRLDTDLAVTTRQKNGNKAALVRGTVGFLQQFGDSESSTVPYVAARIGPTYFDYSITQGSVYKSSKRIGWGGNLEIGVLLSKRLRVSARYDILSEVDGFNFNGFSFGLTYQVARF